MNGFECPGSAVKDFRSKEEGATEENGKRQSQLRQWPVQMHLVSPLAPYYENADVVLSADCVAYAMADFHKDYLKDKSLAIACPKLDDGQDIYVEKIKSLIEDAEINTLTVMIMQVPCCRGLLMMAQQAQQESSRKIPIKVMVVGVQGEILEDTWIEWKAGQ